MRVEIYSDVACPWCYVGERRFAAALRAFTGRNVAVVFRPYQLDPHAPARGLPLREYLARRYGAAADAMLERVTQVAAGEGIAMDWDRAIAVNTATAHRLARLAEEEYGAGVQRALMEKLFDMHFVSGGDVGDREQLVAAAAAVGMDAARARAYLDSGDGAAELDAAFTDARRLGIHAVPTFVFDGRYMVQGAQQTASFLQVLEEVERRRQADPDGPGAGGGACVDGSCAAGEPGW